MYYAFSMNATVQLWEQGIFHISLLVSCFSSHFSFLLEWGLSHVQSTDCSVHLLESGPHTRHQGLKHLQSGMVCEPTVCFFILAPSYFHNLSVLNFLPCSREASVWALKVRLVQSVSRAVCLTDLAVSGRQMVPFARSHSCGDPDTEYHTAGSCSVGFTESLPVSVSCWKCAVHLRNKRQRNSVNKWNKV